MKSRRLLLLICTALSGCAVNELPARLNATVESLERTQEELGRTQAALIVAREAIDGNRGAWLRFGYLIGGDSGWWHHRYDALGFGAMHPRRRTSQSWFQASEDLDDEIKTPAAPDLHGSQWLCG